MNEIPVLVTIHSCARRDDDSEEPISLMTAGTLMLDEEKAVVSYQETLDENLPPQTVRVTVKDDSVTMIREGKYAPRWCSPVASGMRGFIIRPLVRWISPYSAPASAMT